MHYGILHYTKLLFLIHVSFILIFFLCSVQLDIIDIVFTQSGTNYILPTPIVITNYQTASGATPNQNGKICKF